MKSSKAGTCRDSSYVCSKFSKSSSTGQRLLKALLSIPEAENGDVFLYAEPK